MNIALFPSCVAIKNTASLFIPKLSYWLIIIK
jgi:hypothetical protein